MSPSRLLPGRNGRGRAFSASLAVLGLVAAACGSKPAAAPKKSPSPGAGTSAAAAAPANCPLTDLPAPAGGVPNRPVLGVKVENAPEARPQTGLNAADIVYEEPVEGGVTRFLAIYQCQNAARIEPVRSARVEDIDLLSQFPKPLFGNAGGSPPTEQQLTAAVTAGSLVNIDYSGAGYSRDAARNNDEHSLYTSTQALYSRPDAKGGAVPSAIFPFSASPAPGGPGTEVDVNFSQYSDVTWKWNASANVYQRYYNSTTPSNESDGSIMSTPNLIVQEVAVSMSWWVEDSSGSHQPIATLTGTGNAVVCRQGNCVNGTWSRGSASQPTQYLDSSGQPIS
ncbi:MAG: DUF3048 domain-containing protein, partial [Actinomycetota bacterium]